MSVYWKRVADEKPARYGDICYFTDENMAIIYRGHYDKGNFIKYYGVVAEDVEFWCKPNQINSSWGKE